MEFKKDAFTYSITETKNTWVVKSNISNLSVSYSVPKDLCKTEDDIKKYIAENDMF